MTYHWKAWKMGLVVAGVTGLLMGVVTLGTVDKVTWKELLALLVVNVAKDTLLYLKDHPVQQAIKKRTREMKSILFLSILVLAGCVTAKVTKTVSATGTNITFKAHSFLANSALKSLGVDGTTKTTSSLLKLSGATTEPNPEAITASTEGLGTLIGAAAGTMAKTAK